MRSLIASSSLISLFVTLCPVACPGQETGITRKHHPWGCFEVGAWKRVRVITETFNENEALTSTTETKTTLKKVEDDGVTLLVEVVAEVGGKRIDAEPQTVKQGWHGELASKDVKVTQPGTGNVIIRGRRIPCKVQQLELTGPATRTTTKIYYSDTVEPFILRRESVETDLEGTALGETTVEVLDVDVPSRLLAAIRNTFHVKAVHENSKGKTTTVAFTSTRVPGGVIRRATKEFDSSGRMIRQRSLELLDYGLGPEEEWIGPLSRRRSSRIRQSHRFGPYRWYRPWRDRD